MQNDLRRAGGVRNISEWRACRMASLRTSRNLFIYISFNSYVNPITLDRRSNSDRIASHCDVGARITCVLHTPHMTLVFKRQHGKTYF